MTRIHGLYDWLRRNQNFAFPLLAFTIPLIVRAIPEILMGQYIVGFDTIGYYIPGTIEWLNSGINFWVFLADAPLIYLLPLGVASAGGSLIILFKILAPLLLGLLGYTVYLYANKVLFWSPRKSLLVVFLSTIYFVALRISWDMLRSELGLIFLFLSLILMAKIDGSVRNSVLLSLALALVALSHQLITVIMFVIVVATIISLCYYRRVTEAKKLLMCSAPAALLFLFILYVNYFVYSLPATGFSVRYSAGFNALVGASYIDFVVNTLGFLAFCYLPLVPLLLFGVKRFESNIQLKAWIIWLFIPILLVIVSPEPFFIGGVLPYRWILLLTFPLAFYAAHGFASIKWNWYKVAVGFFLAVLSVSFLALPNESAFGYYSYYPTYLPKSMLQNTVQLSDCQDTSNALLWAGDNLPQNARLLTHEAFYGWTTLTFSVDRLIFYGYGDPVVVAQEYSNSTTDSLYLIWWVNGAGWYGQSTIPATVFEEVYCSGNIAIYKCVNMP